MRRFRIVHKGEEIGVVEARSDYAALLRIAGDLGIPPAEITGTYRLPMPGSLSPVYAVETR